MYNDQLCVMAFDDHLKNTNVSHKILLLNVNHKPIWRNPKTQGNLWLGNGELVLHSDKALQQLLCVMDSLVQIGSKMFNWTKK